MFNFLNPVSILSYARKSLLITSLENTAERLLLYDIHPMIIAQLSLNSAYVNIILSISAFKFIYNIFLPDIYTSYINPCPISTHDTL